MLRACVIDFGGSLDQFLPLAKFAYNNNYQSSIQMATYESLFGRQCRSPVGWFELGVARLLGTDLVQDALEKLNSFRIEYARRNLDRRVMLTGRFMMFLTWWERRYYSEHRL